MSIAWVWRDVRDGGGVRVVGEEEEADVEAALALHDVPVVVHGDLLAHDLLVAVHAPERELVRPVAHEAQARLARHEELGVAVQQELSVHDQF